MSATHHSRTTFTHRLHGKIRGGLILIVEAHHHVARKRSADEAKPWVTR